MAEFRRQKSASARKRVQRQIAALSAAAAALLAIGLSVHHSIAHRGITAPGMAGVSERPATPAIRVAEPGGSTAIKPSAAIEPDDSEYANSFVRLPYADDPSELGDGAVVRVEMPRAALMSFGLPVAAMESDGMVQADLILSADGTPEAIRLLPQGNTSLQ